MKTKTLIFLAAEAMLYAALLSFGGNIRSSACFISIILCFIYALTNASKRNILLISGLAATVCADFFLVVCYPGKQLHGMICFLAAQTFYAAMLYLKRKNKYFWLVRAALIIFAVISAILILGEKTDALALISVAYYAQLIVNLIESFTQIKKDKLLPIGFVLFILCDTVIGLQVAAEGYLSIPEASLIYKIIFGDFFLSWFFYLPSQMLISLSSAFSPSFASSENRKCH